MSRLLGYSNRANPKLENARMTIDFARARANMVDGQIRTADVTNPPLLAAFLQVPREEFVPDNLKGLAYLDEELAIGGGRCLLAPAHLAKLIQAATVKPDDIVLDIGCGTGYSAAILSLLSASVVALEADAALVATAGETLGRLGYDNAVTVEGALEDGYAAEGPYDIILVPGACETVPETILKQLREGGRLIAVEGSGNSAMACMWVKDDGVVSRRRLFNCAIPLMPGFEKPAEFVF